MIQIAEHSHDARHWTVESMLEEALSCIEEERDAGEYTPEKAVLILSGRRDGDNVVNVYSAGVTVAQGIGLLEMGKMRIYFDAIGGTNDAS